MRELDWLILRKLYEKRSISKAAEDLYVTQSALTKRVKTIEQEWGVEVVKRSNQGVTFTEDGRYLVKKAGIMLDFLGEIREHFSERHGVKELVRVGVPNSFARLHMPKLLKGYVDAYNRLQFKTFPNSSDMLIRQITDGTIDIATHFSGRKSACLRKNFTSWHRWGRHWRMSSTCRSSNRI